MNCARSLVVSGLLAGAALPALWKGTSATLAAPKVAPNRFQVQFAPNDPTRASVLLEGTEVAPLRAALNGATHGEAVDAVFLLRVRNRQVTHGRALRPLPPLLARLEWGKDSVRLRPQILLTRGLTYEALFLGSKVSPGGQNRTLSFRIPTDERPSSARIERVAPAQKAVPANLLKFYVYFSQPMAEGRVFQYARLRDGLGRVVPQAFHEQELWEDNHRRLTLLINPGRTKRHLGLSESLGPVLRENQSYQLEIRAGLPDQKGRPLLRQFKHSFQTGGFDHRQPELRRWSLIPPKAGTRQPLQVRFDEALDQAITARGVLVMGAGKEPLAGKGVSNLEGTGWQFTPQKPWVAGSYRLVVDADLEDLAGNTLLRRFETAGREARPRPESGVLERGFTVR